ncbi:Wzt carbohydrate-binding domain-containing protein [Enterococcus faecium]
MKKKKSVKTVDRNKNQVERFAAPDIVDVTKAELLDKNKNPVDMLEQGEKLYVKVTYEVKRRYNQKSSFRNCSAYSRQFYVCGLNTLLDGIKIPWKKGENIFYLEYEKLGLLAGEYYFDVAVFEENATVPLVYKTKNT